MEQLKGVSLGSILNVLLYIYQICSINDNVTLEQPICKCNDK